MLPPVSNDIAGVLRRMQPRRQRYRCCLEKNATQMAAISWQLTDQRAHGPSNRAEVADHPLQFALAEANPLRLVRDERADRRRPAHPTLDVQATGQHSRVEVPRQRRPRVDEQACRGGEEGQPERAEEAEPSHQRRHDGEGRHLQQRRGGRKLPPLLQPPAQLLCLVCGRARSIRDIRHWCSLDDTAQRKQTNGVRTDV